MRDESITERTIRATNHARHALLSGYTTYRDLGTEAMENFDASLRDCINRGLTPGPRLLVATHALASTGSYEVRTENRHNGHVLPRASDPADGPWALRAAVRRRVADGADLIKFYADYRRKVMRFPPLGGAVRFPPDKGEVNPSVPLFTQEEMRAIVDEASLAGLPVAAHAGTLRGAMMAARAGVTSLEHVTEGSDELFGEMARGGVIYVPTLAVVEAMSSGREGAEVLRRAQAQVRRAFGAGVRLAAGGDTGTFAHGEGAREMELMAGAGVPLVDVLEACLVGGWEACGGDRCGVRFGWFEEGARADIIALDADPREDVKALRRVSFVMKDGEVYKLDGKPFNWPGEHKWTRD